MSTSVSQRNVAEDEAIVVPLVEEADEAGENLGGEFRRADRGAIVEHPARERDPGRRTVGRDRPDVDVHGSSLEPGAPSDRGRGHARAHGTVYDLAGDHVATNKRTASRDGAEPEVPRRRWGRALLWIGLIGVLVVGAIALSVVFDNGKSDTDVHRRAARRHRSVLSDRGAIQFVRSDRPRFRRCRRAEGSVRSSRRNSERSRPPRSPTISARCLQPFATWPQPSTRCPVMTRSALEVVTQKLDDELAAVSDQANQAAEYIEHWCGPLDSLGTAPPTSGSSLPGPDGG